MRPLSLAERWPGSATVSLANCSMATGRRSAASARSGSRTTPRRCSSRASRACATSRSGCGARSWTATSSASSTRTSRSSAISRATPPRCGAGCSPTPPRPPRRPAGRGARRGHRRRVGQARAQHSHAVSRCPGRLYVLDPVPGWKPTRNRIARLTEPPKHHLADPALATTLLGSPASGCWPVTSRPSPFPRRDLSGSALRVAGDPVGAGVRAVGRGLRRPSAHARGRARDRPHRRARRRSRRRHRGQAPTPSRPTRTSDISHWLREQIGDDLLDAVVVTTGSEAHRRPDGIAVVPAALPRPNRPRTPVLTGG